MGVRFLGWRVLSLGGVMVRVAVVEGWLLAHCTPTGTILINKSLVEKGGPLLRYAVYHELAHEGSIFRLAFYLAPPLTLAFTGLFSVFHLALPLFFAVVLLVSWTAEIHAETLCAKTLGFESFLEARRRLAEEYPARTPLYWLYHPPDRVTLPLARLACRHAPACRGNSKVVQRRENVDSSEAG